MGAPAQPLPSKPTGFRGNVPTPDSCITHLKLLYALRKLRLQIGYENGLWGIYDDRVQKQGLQGGDLQMGLAEIREKRWALFVSRAVYRYAVWWSSFETKSLTVDDTLQARGPRYADYGTEAIPFIWSTDNMMPLDVLMVWHTHMLNPRAFFEDTMRDGMGELWASGMPWHLIEFFVGDDYEYLVHDSTKQEWIQRTGLAWDNLDDPQFVGILCPLCPSQIKMPWTTCESNDIPISDPKVPQPDRLNLVGHGYADGNLQQTCPGCNITVDADLLCVSKFARHAQALVIEQCPMPGTLLDPPTGMPERNSALGTVPKTHAALTAPNRLITDVLYEKILDMVGDNAHKVRPTMVAVRRLIHKALDDDKSLAIISGNQDDIMIAEVGEKLRESMQQHRADASNPARKRDEKKTVLSQKLSTVVRRMLAQYGGRNHSPFSLDLRGAIVRQSVFIDKMYKFDWLHTKTAAIAVDHALIKYERFLRIAQLNPKKMVVPTLDIDLAWHTHQLDPMHYYGVTTTRLGKFLDHDDKVDETKLSTAFDWMCDEYFRHYSEIYSECICWYCEAIRGSPPDSFGARVFGLSDKQKAIKQLHESAGASEEGLHISAHSAVLTPLARERHQTFRRAYADHFQRRTEGLRRAEKLAKKHSRRPPSEQGRYDHWGFPYVLAGAFACPLFFTAALYADDLAQPEAMSGVIADGNIGACVTGCGGLAECGAVPVNVDTGGGGGSGIDVGNALLVTDMFESSVFEGDGGGGDGGGCGGCGGGGD